MDAAKRVRAVGRVSAVPESTPTPSCYQLGDGAVPSAPASVNHALTDAPQSGTGSINHSADMRVCVPRGYKTRGPPRPDRPPTMAGQGVERTTLWGALNDRAMGEDVPMSVRAVAGQVVKADAYGNAGEPAYDLDAQPAIKAVDKGQQSFAPDVRRSPPARSSASQ